MPQAPSNINTLKAFCNCTKNRPFTTRSSGNRCFSQPNIISSHILPTTNGVNLHFSLKMIPVIGNHVCDRDGSYGPTNWVFKSGWNVIVFKQKMTATAVYGRAESQNLSTTIFINGMLCSSEALYGITNNHVTQLEGVATMLFKSVFQSIYS